MLSSPSSECHVPLLLAITTDSRGKPLKSSKSLIDLSPPFPPRAFELVKSIWSNTSGQILNFQGEGSSGRTQMLAREEEEAEG
jgi:hypothetical protein